MNPLMKSTLKKKKKKKRMKKNLDQGENAKLLGDLFKIYICESIIPRKINAIKNVWFQFHKVELFLYNL